ncbi:hypothetical protein [Roseibium sp.]|uniref:hypothetical protein n=1 Tax=Roseibium sp. TaxID=1936156 RepID=UPI003D150A9E
MSWWDTQARIRPWLTGLTVLLLAPSLQFASLWFYKEIEKVQAIDRSLTSLKLIRAFQPMMQGMALTGRPRRLPDHLTRSLAEIETPAQSAGFPEKLQAFQREPGLLLAHRQARDLAAAICRHAEISSSTS